MFSIHQLLDTYAGDATDCAGCSGDCGGCQPAGIHCASPHRPCRRQLLVRYVCPNDTDLLHSRIPNSCIFGTGRSRHSACQRLTGTLSRMTPVHGITRDRCATVVSRVRLFKSSSRAPSGRACGSAAFEEQRILCRVCSVV